MPRDRRLMVMAAVERIQGERVVRVKWQVRAGRQLPERCWPVPDLGSSRVINLVPDLGSSREGYQRPLFTSYCLCYNNVRGLAG